jgi:hypothetical protein
MKSICHPFNMLFLISATCLSLQATAISPGPDSSVNDILSRTEETPKVTQAGASACSNKTLSGTYTYQFEGTRDEGHILTREAGMEAYDGKGTMSVIATFNSVPGGVASFQTTQLSYMVNANCTGVLSGKSGKYADIFVAPDGSSFTFISNVPGQQISGTELRVSKKRQIP